MKRKAAKQIDLSVFDDLGEPQVVRAPKVLPVPNVKHAEAISASSVEGNKNKYGNIFVAGMLAGGQAYYKN